MSRGQISKYRIVAAPNSMKGTLDAFRFADAVERAFHAVSETFEVVKVPVADGGDLTAEVLVRALRLDHQEAEVHGPRGKKVKAVYGLGHKQAVIEMADASGMKLLSPEELDPLEASSAGTGELIRDAVRRGAGEILLGVGGSATIDGGMGLLEGLGVVFYNEKGEQLPASGRAVGEIASWDDSALADLREIKIQVICDVENPLLGENGAVYVFGEQKGADKATLPALEQNLKHFSDLILQKKGRSLARVKGMGAAGGINLALAGFLYAEIVPGADFVLDCIGFDQALRYASLVVTGEGQIDGQTSGNKAPFAVYKRAHAKGVRVVAIGGKVTGAGAGLFDRTYSLMNAQVDQETALSHAEELVYERAVQAATDFLAEREPDQ